MNSDLDGNANDCDICDLDPGDDIDGDGVCGDIDNCVDVANTDQSDIDGDLEGDACDIDDDDDKVLDEFDLDPFNYFVCQDLDGDSCDDCSVEGEPSIDNDGLDSDGDGICDLGDEYPFCRLIFMIVMMSVVEPLMKMNVVASKEALIYYQSFVMDVQIPMQVITMIYIP